MSEDKTDKKKKISSAQKRHQQAQIRTIRNRARMNRIRTFIKKVEHTIQENQYEEALSAYKAAQPEIHRGITKGLLHKNKGARKLKRLSNKIKHMQQ